MRVRVGWCLIQALLAFQQSSGAQHGAVFGWSLNMQTCRSVQLQRRLCILYRGSVLAVHAVREASLLLNAPTPSLEKGTRGPWGAGKAEGGSTKGQWEAGRGIKIQISNIFV